MYTGTVEESMYTGTVIDELMDTVERATSRATECAMEDGQEMWMTFLPQPQDSLAGAA